MTSLLTWTIRLPPERHHAWGQAMQAELAAIADPAVKRRFARGCTRAILTHPATALTVSRPMTVVAAAVAALAAASGIADQRVRLESVGMVAALIACVWLGHRPNWTADGPSRFVRSLGYALIAASTTLTLDIWRRWPKDAQGIRDTAFVGVPLTTAMLLTEATVILLLTRRRQHIGALTGLAAGLAWLIPVLLRPTVPQSAGAPILVVLAAMATAVVITARRDEDPYVAGLATDVIATLTITVSTNGLLQLFPAHVPPIVNPVVPPGTSAADILANNEVESTDPYVAVTAIGFLLAIALAIVLIRRCSGQAKGNASACATSIPPGRRHSPRGAQPDQPMHRQRPRA